MAQPKLTARDLRAALDDIGERFRNLSLDDRFVLWFLRAYVTESEDRAAEAISGGARDKGIDALFIDDAARAIFVVQGKYHKEVGQTTEKRADVVSLAEIAHRLSEPTGKLFSEFLSKADGYVAERLKEARKRVINSNYRIWLYFVTLGNVSASTRKDAQSLVRTLRRDATIEVIDGRRAMLLFRDYLDGVAPPIPTLDLEMEQGAHVTVNGVSQRYDDKNNIESWVFSMRGDAVASLYERAGVRLFARNIRGFLGSKTAVNQRMVATLEREPDRFFYYNNGITILCDEAIKKSRKGKDILQVSNPQVINGQQTTRTLADFPEDARKASVLVKVIQVARDETDTADRFEGLVSPIVAGTNRQNSIRPSDLMSNDRIQIDIDRSLRNLGYVYIRKRQTKTELKRAVGGKHFRFVKKEEFAQAVAACDLDPIVARTSREKLFEEDKLYKRVFPNSDPDFYLPRYHLMREVAYCARGNRQRREARWLVLNLLWSKLALHVRSARNARAFRIQCERQDADLVSHLNRAVERAFVIALKFYRENRGKGTEAVDVATFFKSKRSTAKAFLGFWHDSSQADRQFERHFSKAVAAIRQFEA